MVVLGVPDVWFCVECGFNARAGEYNDDVLMMICRVLIWVCCGDESDEATLQLIRF